MPVGKTYIHKNKCVLVSLKIYICTIKNVLLKIHLHKINPTINRYFESLKLAFELTIFTYYRIFMGRFNS